MTPEEHYTFGRDEGFERGQVDMSDGLGAHHEMLTVLEEGLHWAGRRTTRAHALGFLRGYRDAVRTLRDGRWGT